MDSDIEGHISWVRKPEELCQELARGKAGEESRYSMSKQDPWHNPVHKFPYYIEWLTMAAQAQRFVESCACAREKNKAEGAPLPALCLMNSVRDKNVCVKRCGSLFGRLYLGWN